MACNWVNVLSLLILLEKDCAWSELDVYFCVGFVRCCVVVKVLS